ncbi:hypothetical protein IC575_008227 [Cucumis melo]
MWQVDEKLWKAYLEWKRSRKTTHEERKVVSTTRKKYFFKQLEENTWILGDTGINEPDCIVWQHLFDTHLLTPDNKNVEWTNTTAHLNIWVEEDLEYYFNTAVGDFQEKSGWGDVNYVIGYIDIKEHWLTIATDMRKCKIYVFDSMPNYVEKKHVDQALEMHARCIVLLAIAIGVNLHSKRFKYSPWPVRRSNTTLQKGHSMYCGIFYSKFIECLVTEADHGCLTVKNMKLFIQQYVLKLWSNKYFW